MEIKKECKKEYLKNGQDDMKESFIEIKNFVNKVKNGIALVNESEEEKLFMKENINDLFCFINENNLKEIEYIQDDFLNNEIANDTIKGFIVTLNNEKKYTIEII